MNPIPIICGPTGSGKTQVAHQLASQFPIEIVSADSRQLVRYLDIGTAKPTVDERRQVPYHLLDLIEPGERYSAFRFIGDANRVIAEIRKRGNLPVVVGGTGLYLRALTEGVVEIEEPDMTLRAQLEKEADAVGSEAMHKRLMEIDPLEAAKVHPNNRVKVIRALEIFALTGKSKSELMASGLHRKGQDQFSFFILTPDRAELYCRINDRVDRMISAGWQGEISALVAEGKGEGIRRANIIGYSDLMDVQEGKMALEEALARIKQETRQYAKRQLTWFRHQTSGGNFKDINELREVAQKALG